MSSKVSEAKAVLRRHFVNALNAPIRTPRYQHQLQVLYESDFFWWVIADALRELVDEGYLVMFDRERVPDLADLNYMHVMKFYANANAIKTARDETIMKKHVLSTARMLDRYSSNANNKVLGNHLESLVANQLKILQFEILGRNANRHGGKKWDKTSHNLDLIARRNNLVIGVEVKNSLNIIPAEEIDVKIDMCRHLGIVPVFAVRWIKPYIDCIRRQGGFSWVFKTQMLPLGHERIAENMYKRLSVLGKKDGRGHQLEFPITTRSDLPPKSVEIFERWMEKIESCPPTFKSNVRCSHRKGTSPASIPSQPRSAPS